MCVCVCVHVCVCERERERERERVWGVGCMCVREREIIAVRKHHSNNYIDVATDHFQLIANMNTIADLLTICHVHLQNMQTHTCS